MIKFQRRRLHMYVCYCDDVPDYQTDPPILEFNDKDSLIKWLKTTLKYHDDESCFEITDNDTVLHMGGCIGWIVNNDRI